MTSLGAMLKDEITRLSRKEARKQVEPIRAASASYRRQIAELKRVVVLLQRQVAALSRAGKTTAAPPAEPTSTRFVAKGLRTLRGRLDLSAADFGELAGVSGQSIYNWEQGKAVPRKAQLSVLVGLRALGKREAHARLLQVRAKAAKSPGKSAAKR
jgi:DNA-binding transcriptional regulator YiaG